MPTSTKRSKTSTTQPGGAKASTGHPLYELKIDLQVLKHLGIGLYSNVPAIASEMVANAYDADAKEVDIIVKDQEIVVEDDGLGMNVDDANQKFLTVGYDKRASGEIETPKLKRKPMGRKGIGKLSAFAIAEEVEVQSVKTDPRTGRIIGTAAFTMDVAEIEKCARARKPYHPLPLAKHDPKLKKGTRITLRRLKRKRSIKSDYVRINLARRFSIFSGQFKVSVNDQRVSAADRQYWDKLQFVWGLGDNPAYQQAAKGKKVRNEEVLSNVVKIEGGSDETVTGWIGTVHLPKELKDGAIDNNGIVVMARGKLVHENMLPFARTSRIFAEYVVGEINADWMDDDSEADMATSDRQSLREDDPRFLALRSYVIERLEQIASRWDEWRKQVGLKDAVTRHPVLQKWLDEMTSDNRKHAEKLISTIEGMPVADLDDKKELLRHGIMAFETLALKGNLASLSEATADNMDAFDGVLQAMEDLEVAHYYQVVKTRWAVLQKVEKLVDQNEKEKFLQEKIYENTWLMDTGWERATRDKRKERRFIGKLKARRIGLDKNAALSRYDIKYLTVSGKDLVIELKRSGRLLTVPEIVDQVRKYSEIMIEMASASGVRPNFDIIVLVGKLPKGYNQKDEDALKPYRSRVMTYEQLIDHARATYGDFLDNQKKVERIQKMVDAL
jgi:Histidine kinase-, DNA gyrase B-, and HSP90-like ATPase